MFIKSITSLVAMLFALSMQAQIAAVHFTVLVPPSIDTKNLYIAGSFNNWTAADSLYKMQKVNDSTYITLLPVYKGVKYEYKYTRGGWSNVELLANDSSVNNRQFVAAKRKYKIHDRVEKWNQPPTPQVSTQQSQMNSMKDSLMARLQPRFDRLYALLKEYTFNQLQERPSIELDQRITDTLVHGFADMYGNINSTVQKIFNSLSSEQKKQVLQKLNDPMASRDFINVLGAALSDVMKDKTMNAGRPKQS